MDSVPEAGLSSLFGKYFAYQSIIGINRIIPNKSARNLSIAIFLSAIISMKI
jgi:hypothetical protein